MLQLLEADSRWSLVVRQSFTHELLVVGRRPTTNDQRRSVEIF